MLLLMLFINYGILNSVRVYAAIVSWNPVGSPGFSNGQAKFPSIATAKDGTLYVVYQDSGNGEKATVMKYSGSSWKVIGNAGFSDDKVDNNTTIAIDNHGIPYIVYSDCGKGYKATINASVTWNNGSPAYDKDKAGIYTFIGTLSLPTGVANTNGLTASVDVIVGAEVMDVTNISEINNINVNKGTDISNIGLPETIDVELSNSTTTNASVTWNNGSPEYDKDTNGKYIFIGILTLPSGVTNPSDLRASVYVTVGEIDDDTPTNNETTSVKSVNIKGSPIAGKTLESVLLTNAGAKYTTSAGVVYNWYRLSSIDSSNGDSIGDNDTYKLESRDIGKYIK